MSSWCCSFQWNFSAYIWQVISKWAFVMQIEDSIFSSIVFIKRARKNTQKCLSALCALLCCSELCCVVSHRIQSFLIFPFSIRLHSCFVQSAYFAIFAFLFQLFRWAPCTTAQYFVWLVYDCFYVDIYFVCMCVLMCAVAMHNNFYDHHKKLATFTVLRYRFGSRACSQEFAINLVFDCNFERYKFLELQSFLIVCRLKLKQVFAIFNENRCIYIQMK